MDVVRRQLAQPRAHVASHGRSPERQGDGELDRARGRAKRRRGERRAARRQPHHRRRTATARNALARDEADRALSDGHRRRADDPIRPPVGDLPSRRSRRLRTAIRVRDAGEPPVAPRRLQRHGRDHGVVRAARRAVPVREARAPAVVDALRRDGERERDLLRRQAVSRREGDGPPARARDGASVVRRRGDRARVGAPLAVGGVRRLLRCAVGSSGPRRLRLQGDTGFASRQGARRQRRTATSGDRHGADGLHGAPQREQLRQGRVRAVDAAPSARGQRVLSRRAELLPGASPRQRSSGRSLAQFFDQWLRRPGWAEPAVGWAYDAATGTVSLFALQEGQFGAFALSLPIDVTDAANARHHLVVDIPATPRATVPLPGHFPRRPASLDFDPDSTLLAHISRL
jgi:hypothetical protein